MIGMAKQQDVSVMLIGVRLPPNLGVAYNLQFQKIFDSVSARHDIYYLAKFLEGVAAGDADLMQNDAIHPTTKAQPILANKVLSALLIMLNQ